jgi:Flp pilus assembly secretin CpaC
MNILKNLAVITTLGVIAIQAHGQDAKSAGTAKVARASDTKVETARNLVPLKVTVVFNEYDGDKKLSSLPYVLFVKTDETARFVGRVRMGVRVPIWTGGKDSAVQYQDVGSNLDCGAQALEEGKYMLDLSLERSSLYPSSGGKGDTPEASKFDDQSRQPLVRTFRANLALMLRDGQTAQNSIATDPLNGHVIKVEVTLNVVR